MGPHPSGIRAVLFDRDGTLVRDVPYNGDPALVEPMPHARRSLDRLRTAGILIGLVSNQSGIGRGLLSHAQVHAVNERLEQLVGGFDVSLYCPHVPADECGCRKPRPGLVQEACRMLGVPAAQTVVVGDIGSDVAAARAAGAAGVLVPTPATRPAEVRAADQVARDLPGTVDLILAGALAPADGIRRTS